MPQLLSSHLDAKFLASFDIDRLFLSPDHKYVVAGSRAYPSANVAFFDPYTGELKQELPLFYKGFELRLAVNHLTNEFVYWTTDEDRSQPRTYYLYRIYSENDIFKYEKLPISFQSEGYYTDITFTLEATYIARAEGLLVLDTKSNNVIKEIKCPFYDDSNGNAISKDGRYVAFGHYDTNKVEVYDTHTSQLVKSFKVTKLHDSHGAHLSFVGDSYKLMSAADSTIEFWDALEGKLLSKINCTGIYSSTIMDMRLSPNGQYLTTQHTGRMLSVYDLNTNEQIWLESYVDNMDSACFTPDNEWLLYNSGKRINRIATKTGKKDPNESATGSTEFSRLYTLPLENRLLAFNGMQAAHINATTGAIEKVLYAYNNPTYAFNPHEVDANKNLLCGGGHGASVGNAVTGKLKSILSRYYGGLALSSDYVASCHAYISNETKKLLQIHNHEGKNSITLAKDYKNLPVRGIEFLGDSNLLAGLGEKFAAVWDADSQTQVWNTPLKVGYARLFTHESGTHLFIVTAKHTLLCLNANDGSQAWEYAPRKDKKYKEIEFKSVFGRGDKVICLMKNGDLRCLDLSNGTLLHNLNICDAGSECAALAADNTIYIVNANTGMMHYDIKDWLGEAVKGEAVSDTKSATAATPKSAKAFQLPAADSSESAMLSHFNATQWEGFVWDNDAAPLIAFLNALEERAGVTDVHRLCTDKLLRLQSKQARTTAFKLIHRYGHVGNIVSYGMSPDGRYLASGSWVGDDYEEGGELMIWDVKTGRCVNVIDNVEGGVGWPDYGNCIQWSPDGQLLGLAVNTNSVVVAEPFSDTYEVIEDFNETDGWSRPPQWCWAPNNKAVFIACWTRDNKLPGCVCPLDAEFFPMKRPYGFNKPVEKGIFTQDEIDTSDNSHDEGANSPLSNFKTPRWSSKGYLFGTDNSYAYTLDPQTRALGTVIKDINAVSTWSPDGDYFLWVQGKDIKVLDAEGKELRTIPVGTDLIGNVLEGNKSKKSDSLLEVSIGNDGLPTLLFGRTPIKDIEKIYWHPDASKCLFAAAVLGEFGYLAFYQNFELLGIAKTDLFELGTWDLSDALPLAFSLDGTHAASLADTRQVTIWQLEQGVKAKTTYQVHEESKGLFWGIDNRLMTLHDNYLCFYEAFTGNAISQYSTLFEDSEPVALSYSPLGQYASNFEVNPYFPYEYEGEAHWIAAFATGLVVCPKPLRSVLDKELTYTIANRYVWPYRWGDNLEVENLEKALGMVSMPLNTKAKNALKKTFESQPVAKNPDDYFLTVTKAEIFGKEKKVGKFQFGDNSRSFWKDTKKAFQVETLQLGVKKAKDYTAPIVFKGDDITEANLRTLLGKVVLYTDSYSRTKVQLGTVVSVDSDSFMQFHIDFNDQGVQGSCGSGNTSFDNLVSIGEAQIR